MPRPQEAMSPSGGADHPPLLGCLGVRTLLPTVEQLEAEIQRERLIIESEQEA